MIQGELSGWRESPISAATTLLFCTKVQVLAQICLPESTVRIILTHEQLMLNILHRSLLMAYLKERFKDGSETTLILELRECLRKCLVF